MSSKKKAKDFVAVRGTKREGEVDIILKDQRKPPKRKKPKLYLPTLTLSCEHTGYEFCQHCEPSVTRRHRYHHKLLQLSKADQAIVVGERKTVISPSTDPALVRKGPKRAGKLTTTSPFFLLRLPVRTLACAHGRTQICDRCVEGVPRRLELNSMISEGPRILRVDAWRASSDTQQRREAGMIELNTTMAEVQRQIMLHEKFVCDGCVHCKEDSHV